MKISKEFDFEMAHRLVDSYSQECKNIHGHSYHMVFTIESTPDKSGYILPACGNSMVMDLKRLKEIVVENILKRFDHVLLLSDKDPLWTLFDGDSTLVKHYENISFIPELSTNFSLYEYKSQLYGRILKCTFNPTAENMVLFFKSILNGHEEFNKFSISIKLFETRTGSVEE